MAQSVAFAVDVHVVVGTLARITDGFYQEVMWAAFVAAQMCRSRVGRAATSLEEQS